MNLKAKSISSTAWIAAAVLTLLSTAPLPAQTAECDAKSFNGAFGYRLSGYAYDALGYSYMLGVAGRMVSDGAGNLTGADSYSFDGTIFKRQYTGTYTINADCTGSLTIATPNGNTTHADFVAVNNGAEIELVQTDAGFILTGELKRQFAPVPAPQPAPPAQ